MPKCTIKFHYLGSVSWRAWRWLKRESKHVALNCILCSKLLCWTDIWYFVCPEFTIKILAGIFMYHTTTCDASTESAKRPQIAHTDVANSPLNFRQRASCILWQAFHYSPENAFYIFNQQIYFIIWYLLDRASLI